MLKGSQRVIYTLHNKAKDKAKVIVKDKVKDMSKIKKYCLYSLGLISIGFIVSVGIPALIGGFFWVMLQMMLFPLTTLVILVNLLLWNYLYIRYTENKLKKSTK